MGKFLASVQLCEDMGASYISILCHHLIQNQDSLHEKIFCQNVLVVRHIVAYTLQWSPCTSIAVTFVSTIF
jgi:hypothetical protein